MTGAQPTEPRPARHAAVGVGAVLGVLLVLLLVGWAASTERNPVFTGPGWERNTAQPGTESPTPSASATAAAEPEQQPTPASRTLSDAVLVAISVSLIALVLGLMLLAALAALRYFWRLRRAQLLVPGDEIDFAPLDLPAAAAALVADAQEQRRLLAGGEARNAIVRCWERFETQASGAGVARRPWETSSEYVVRALADLRVEADPVRRLERLFVEARFSAHRIVEQHREEALAALDAIHADLRRRAERRTQGERA